MKKIYIFQKNHRPHISTIKAFTLIEVLVVVAIIALLAAILIPSLSAARSKAHTVQCATNLRTCGQGINFYLQANKDIFFGGNWASLIHKYLQRYSKKDDGSVHYADGRGALATLKEASSLVEYYLCPGDEVYHGSSSVWVRTKGNWENVTYPLSYGVNNSMIYNIKETTNPNNGQSWLASVLTTDVPDVPESAYGYLAVKNWPIKVAPNKENIYQTGMRKASRVKRPYDVIMLMDSADDDMTSGIWLYDQGIDSHNNGGLQVHHRDGNNFLYGDYHVDFKKVFKSAYQRNIPHWPWAWIPINGWKVSRTTNKYNPYDQDYSTF